MSHSERIYQIEAPSRLELKHLRAFLKFYQYEMQAGVLMEFTLVHRGLKLWDVQVAFEDAYAKEANHVAKSFARDFRWFSYGLAWRAK